jgi:hypothetical protein
MTENNRIEYKSSYRTLSKKEVVAFLNYRDGGLIYNGIAQRGIFELKIQIQCSS